MKKYLFIISSAFILSACGTNETENETAAVSETTAVVQANNNTTIEWVDSSYQDLGKVKEGQTVEVTYRF